MKSKKIKNTFMGALIAITLGFFLKKGIQIVFATTSEIIEQYNELGTIWHYNGVIFDTYTAEQADVEGALAVGGTAHLGTKGQGFDVGGSYNPAYNHIGHYENIDGYPTLLLNGDSLTIGLADNTDNHAWYNVYGGPIVMSESLYTQYDATYGNNHKKFGLGNAGRGKVEEMTVSDSLLNNWFDNQYTLVKDIGRQYMKANNETVSWNDFINSNYFDKQDPVIYENKTLYDANGELVSMLSITVTSDEVINLDWVGQLGLSYNWVSNYDFIVVNFPNVESVIASGHTSTIRDYPPFNLNGTSMTLSKEQIAVRKEFAEKVVWNFPNATSIRLEYSFILGSIIAPEATVSTMGGSINGQLVARNFEQMGGMELHALAIKRDVYTPLEEPIIPHGSIQLTKLLKFNGELTNVPLEGATYTLYKLNDESNEYEVYLTDLLTNTQGQLTVNDLPLGNYKLRETQAPPGYNINNNDKTSSDTYYEYIIELTEENFDIPIEIIKYNEPLLTSVRFEKVDEKDSTIKLEGAKFALYRVANPFEEVEGDILIGIVTSDEAGTFTFQDLPIGIYRLSEVNPPDGYLSSNIDHSFSIEYDESSGEFVIMKDDIEQNDVIQITNTKEEPPEDKPDTGVEDHKILYVITLLVSGLSMIVLAIIKRKKKTL